MLKKILIICLSFFGLLAIYFFSANWFFYHQIEISGLQISDLKNKYVFNETATTSPGLVYVALGDSLTAGIGVADYEQSYPYLIAQKIAGKDTKVTHLNFSYPGYKTDDLIRDMLPEAIASQPDIVTILIGVNDVHDNNNRQRFRQNYEVILQQLSTKTNAKINVISIPFIGSKHSLWPVYRAYYYSKSLIFNDIIRELADKYQVNYIDLTNFTQQYSLKPGYYAVDGFHLSDLGYQYWSQIIYDHLSK
ncbi:MAG TPA: SGNH/GDSL hydrolase family protein [Candidatus Saccharimonadales bacterium]|nr:SGNH/GDSL hydrolase family protein [Candidatus Saccharimonadales bacterium]